MRKRLPWVWTGLVAVVSVVLFMTGSYDAAGFGTAAAAASWLLLPILFTASGSIVLSRQPGNRIGWILMVVALGVLLDSAAQPYVQVAPVSPTMVDYVMIGLANTMWMVIFFSLFLLLYLFPDGRWLTRRWSWAGWLAAVMAMTLLIIGALGPEIRDPNDQWVIDNPMAVFSTDVFSRIEGLWFVGLLVLPLGGLTAMVLRFRRSPPVVRTQIKWVLYSAIVLSLVYAFSVVAVELGGAWSDLTIGVLFSFAIALIPISITAAIVRYKLFEIDRLISRTLSYTVVVALLGALYFGTVTAVTSFLPTQNAIAVAGSTLLVAALFNPVRRRVQSALDRRFNRSAYEAQLISADFAVKLQESLTAEELTAVWAETVDRALHPSSAGVWISPRHG